MSRDSFRISPQAPYGSLLKGNQKPRENKTKKAKPAFKNPREHDTEHLEAIRQCPCLSCGTDPAGEAAHLRMTTPGKVNPGMQQKPHDLQSLPLCRTCHTKQHSMNEAEFWKALGIDPLRIIATLATVSPNVEAMRSVINVAYAISKTEAK